MNREKFINSTYESISKGVNKGLLHLTQTGALSSDNFIHFNGMKLSNFTSCSYLGLEHDVRLKNAAIEAVNKYGVQFSESRAYVSIELYQKLEELMCEIFGAPAIVAPTTTLAHIAAIPVLLNEEDAVIVDQQLHNSVLNGINVFRANYPVYFEVLRHSRLDILEDRIKELEGKYKRIWYFADGIYSMFGDRCPINGIFNLLNAYDSFYSYIDDAHAMSILGENGKGSVLANQKIHTKMIIATSMAKGFATGGGVLIFPNKELARKVRTCGGPFNSSGPLQPATLGAAVASATIHLTDEIYLLQNELLKRIHFAHSLLKNTILPIISNYDSAIFFVGTSKSNLAYEIMERMIKRGFLVNLGIFPAVSKNHSGVRFTITILQSYEQIEKMILTLNEEFMNLLERHNYSVNQINTAFRSITRLDSRTLSTF